MIYVNVVLEGYQNERYMLTAQLIKGKSSHPSKMIGQLLSTN
jgi:hypothetical protein